MAEHRNLYRAEIAVPDQGLTCSDRRRGSSQRERLAQRRTLGLIFVLSWLGSAFWPGSFTASAAPLSTPVASYATPVANPSSQNFGTLTGSVEVQAVNHVMTNVPAAFNGMVVNNFLGANRFYSNGITGQSTITANVEAGHLWGTGAGHESLTHVTNYQHHADAFGTTTNELFDRHATWTGMLIGGRNGGANQGNHQTGIAPGTDLRSGATASSWSGSAYSLNFNQTANSFVQPYNAFFGTADVINSSWGFTDAPGINPYTIAFDGFAYNNPQTTSVVSAGNSGPGANTVGSPGAGYNSITVGATGNANSYGAVANFSSRGPQSWSDGSTTISAVRSVVDIVAPGTGLTSAYYGGQSGGNHAGLAGSPNGGAGGPAFYSHNLAGTSFAAPIVAGGAALIASASYNTPSLASNDDSRDARVMKAVLLNSADKLAGWNNGQIAHVNANGGVQTTQSLDYAQGAGQMNLDRAFDQYLAGTTDVAGTGSGNLGQVGVVGWDFGVVQAGVDNDYFIDTPLSGGSQFTVTLGWFRYRDFNPNSLTYADLAQANLDLTVFDATGGVFSSVISESYSTYNVVEHLSFAIPQTGMYGIRVSFAGTLFDLTGVHDSESYGLAWFGVAGELTGAAFVPEPSSFMLFACSLFVLRRRRRPKGHTDCFASVRNGHQGG